MGCGPLPSKPAGLRDRRSEPSTTRSCFSTPHPSGFARQLPHFVEKGASPRMESLSDEIRRRPRHHRGRGLPRRRFTVAEVEAMVAAGLMEEDERVELIGVELVPMSPKGHQHEVVKTALLRPVDSHSSPRMQTLHAGNDVPPFRRYLSRTRRRYLFSLDGAERPPPGRKRIAGRRDRGFLFAVRHGAQGRALRQLRRARTLGDRRGQADDPRLPRPALAERLRRDAGLRRVGSARAAVRARCLRFAARAESVQVVSRAGSSAG